MKNDIVIKFDSEEAARHFAIWLCEAGEQDYWQWMEVRETEDPGNITVVSFDYHGKNEFMKDGIIRTRLGRLTDD